MRMKGTLKNVKKPGVWLVGAALLAIGWKLLFLRMDALPFNSDEAIVGLMARHILQGERPIFFYGQAYMGSLDAFLVAGAFQLLGQSAWALRLVQVLLYAGTVVTGAWLVERALGDWSSGLATALLLAIPTVNSTLYTTVSLGGYGEALLLGNVCLLLALRIDDQLGGIPARLSAGLIGILGILNGLGLWVFGLSLVYIAPADLLVAWKLWKLRAQIPQRRWIARLFLFFIAGVAVGAFPWLVSAFRSGMAGLTGELAGGAIAGVEGMGFASRLLQHLVSLLVLGSTVVLGFRPPWAVRWLVWPLLPLVLVFWLAVFAFLGRRLVKRPPLNSASLLLIGVVFFLTLAFLLTPFGADPSGRYFLPLALPLVVGGVAFIRAASQVVGRYAWGMVGLLLVFHAWGTVECALHSPPGLTTQFDAVAQVDHRYLPALISFLRENGEKAGYSNYWVSYPLAFYSNEELIYLPRLPYHQDFRYTERDDRYPPYREIVRASERVAYITTHHAALDEALREKFRQQGVTWKENQIGDYHIFYALSAVVRPEQIGLGTTTP